MTVAVLGGGLMGSGIAQVFAAAGFATRIYDPSSVIQAALPARIRESLAATGGDPATVDLIEITGDLAKTVTGASFVTECAPEKIEVKRELFKALVEQAPADAILATNTSVISITSIAEGLPTAERIVGTHWWNPAPLIPLVEVVPGEHTSADTVRAAMAMMRRIGKSPAQLHKDVPGFIGNRLQFALWREAISMVADGICDAATLDLCVKSSFGRRLAVLGPLENADLIGLDLTLDIHRTIIPELDRHAAPHEYLEARVASGKLGFKTGEGFKIWSEEDMLRIRQDLITHLLSLQGAPPPNGKVEASSCVRD
ncbi:3-hydroxyacyl-CoA dehydrogenase family protein (plasmid) [Novosphingobium resinovorum]|uniref:3-hydroxyacyl-CoA dehydrogenase family protein n=1 Tax=Novosphingobium TaxID=165696 RepID=UPI001B3C6CF9|nr:MULTISPECIES: 3-hydroxyacyl-CoA dehydrogenase family protein [Novosphingobium]MBF7015294.1 3-hydroxyacyl-CoA dehydrogenase family protein [Novosphingobium sp. HR1a]WJM29972.1 3-hydroxyacyl-CoA dehydrogenase family protein [Novosphingobium resinovorum]